jgi:hypothetical protein
LPLITGEGGSANSSSGEGRVRSKGEKNSSSGRSLLMGVILGVTSPGSGVAASPLQYFNFFFKKKINYCPKSSSSIPIGGKEMSSPSARGNSGPAPSVTKGS